MAFKNRNNKLASAVFLIWQHTWLPTLCAVDRRSSWGTSLEWLIKFWRLWVESWVQTSMKSGRDRASRSRRPEIDRSSSVSDASNIKLPETEDNLLNYTVVSIPVTSAKQLIQLILTAHFDAKAIRSRVSFQIVWTKREIFRNLKPKRCATKETSQL